MKVVFPYPGFENLGVEYLSAVLKEAGHLTALVFDPQLFHDKFLSVPLLRDLYSMSALLVDQIVSAAPDLVAFSVISADLGWALEVARQVKDRCDAVMVFGGIHPTAAPRETLRHRVVDYVIVGEGEYPLLELVEALEAGDVSEERLRSIRNLGFGIEGQIVINPLRPFISDLDSLPFPDKELYYEALPFLRSEYSIITRRGCINSCTYCHNSLWAGGRPRPSGPRVRLRSVENVMAELRRAYDAYRFEKLRINDDTFTSDRAWLREFSAAYAAEFTVPVWCYVAPQTIDADTVRYLQRMGCFQVSIGVQSIREEIRGQVLHRRDTNHQIVEALRLFREAGIRCITDNLIGVPGQTEDELLELARFYVDHPVDRICLYWLIYFPGTQIVDIAVDRGDIDAQTKKEITARPVQSANTVFNRHSSEEFVRYNLLLLAIHFLPGAVLRRIIDRRLHRFFPLINPALIEIPMTVMMDDRKEIERVRYFNRYWHHACRIPLAKARRITSRLLRRARREDRP